MKRLLPIYYPHGGRYAYCCTREGGFFPRVVKRLRRRGFTKREIEKLSELYFACSDEVRRHQDELGVFRNIRSCRLHRLSRRQMKYDRKNPLFELVLRSGMFYVFLDDDGRVMGFLSPRVYGQRGVLRI